MADERGAMGDERRAMHAATRSVEADKRLGPNASPFAPSHLHTSELRPAVFLDRDGTLNEDRGYVGFPRDLVWLSGAIEAVRRLNEAGFVVVVVTNQAGVARGYYGESDVVALHGHMDRDLAVGGARVDGWYYSPYHVAGVLPEYAVEHEDRKPGTGMFDRAIQEHAIDPSRSYVVGDKVSDLEPGRTLGMTTILVRTGYGRESEGNAPADRVADDLTAAVEFILAHAGHSPARQA